MEEILARDTYTPVSEGKETTEVSKASSHPIGAHPPRDGGYLCHHLAKLTKTLGEACMEAFTPLNFHFEMKYDTDTHSADGWQHSCFL